MQQDLYSCMHRHQLFLPSAMSHCMAETPHGVDFSSFPSSVSSVCRVAWDSRTHRYNRDSGQKGKRSSSNEEPYRMRAVGHSLGGASLLIYAVTRSMAKQPTHLCRLILLTPAGFQQNYPKVQQSLWCLILLTPLLIQC